MPRELAALATLAAELPTTTVWRTTALPLQLTWKGTTPEWQPVRS